MSNMVLRIAEIVERSTGPSRISVSRIAFAARNSEQLRGPCWSHQRSNGYLSSTAMESIAVVMELRAANSSHRLERFSESTASKSVREAKLRTSCGNPNLLCAFHRSKEGIHGTILCRKTARQRVARLIGIQLLPNSRAIGGFNYTKSRFGPFSRIG